MDGAGPTDGWPLISLSMMVFVNIFMMEKTSTYHGLNVDE